MATRSFRRAAGPGGARTPVMQTQPEAARAAQGRQGIMQAQALGDPATRPEPPPPLGTGVHQPRDWQGYQPYEGYDAKRQMLEAQRAARVIPGMKRGGVVKGRGDGIARRGHTKGTLR